MLSPEYYENCADDVIRLYEQLEDDIISDVVRRIMKSGKVTATARHRIEQLQEVGILYDDILSEIAKNTDATNQHVRVLFEDAGVETVRFDNRIYRENGLTPVDIRQSPAMRQTLEAGYRKTLGNVKNLTMTTANTSQTAYINACNSAYMQVASGAFSYQEAIKNAIKKTAENGVKVTYPSGHTERVDMAVRRSVLTGVGQTCREIGIMNAEECGCDLMEISAHSGARPSHAQWQGKIVSLSGKKGYLSKSDIGYGTGDGFGGWNCRHDWYPFFEGYSKRNYSAKSLAKLDERNIEYNGKMYNQYEISQIQRKFEREIRSAKREEVAFKVAVEEANDPDLEQVMLDALNYAKSLVKKRQAKMRDFIRQTGQNRDYFREQNYPKENSRKDLTSSENSGKMETERAISFKRVDKAIEYAKNKLSISADALSVLPVEKVNVILSHISRLYAKMPALDGFVDEIILEKMGEIAKASVKWVDGKPLIRLKLSSSIFSSMSIEEIESFINDAVKNKDFSYKEGLYGVLKHEFAHMAEYLYTLKRYNYSQEDVSKSLDSFEFARQVKELALKNCNLEDNNSVIKNYIGKYATENPAEFVAEAYSSEDNNKLVNETKRILKRKWGI